MMMIYEKKFEVSIWWKKVIFNVILNFRLKIKTLLSKNMLQLKKLGFQNKKIFIL